MQRLERLAAGGSGQGLMLERSALRADSPAVLGLVARRKLASFAALTTLRQTRRSQITKRAGARRRRPCAPRRHTNRPCRIPPAAMSTQGGMRLFIVHCLGQGAWGQAAARL